MIAPVSTRKRRMSAVAIAALTLCGAAPAPTRIVLIDVGHSAKVYGARGASGRTEFAYNLALSQDLAKAMRRRGWTVVMPNSTGTVRTLAERPRSATLAKADLFIAVHHDSVQEWQMPNRDRYGGYSVWTSGSHPAARASEACGRIVGDVMRNAGMKPNLSHAEPPPGANRTLLDPRIGHYRRDDLAVLRRSTTPALLFEAGVIVNPREERWLGRDEVRKAIAENLAHAADRCVPAGTSQ